MATVFTSAWTATTHATARILVSSSSRHLRIVGAYYYPQQQQQLFSSQPPKKGKKSKAADGSSSSTTNLSYLEAKKVAKEIRTQRFIAKNERKSNLKNRRSEKKGIKSKTFRNWFQVYKINNEYYNRKQRQQPPDTNKEWKIEVAAIIERIPIVLPDKDTWEIEWEDLKAYLSQYGKKYPAQYGGTDIEPEPLEKMTEEFLLANYLPRGFVPAPRETPDDESGNVRSIHRKLKTRIYLTVLDNTDHLWKFPTATVNTNETLLDATKRAISDHVSIDTSNTNNTYKDLSLYYPSNCPIGVDIDIFDKDTNEEDQQHYYGKKTFFMKVQYDEDSKIITTMDDFDNLTLMKKAAKGNSSKMIEDFAWLDRNEISRKIKEQYSKNDVDIGERKSKLYYYML